MKKNNYKYNFIAFLTLIFISMNACTDLEETLEGDFKEKNFKNQVTKAATETTVKKGPVDAAFSKLLSGTANHGNMFSVNEVWSDEVAIPAKGSDWYDGGIWVDMHRHTYDPNNGPLNNCWNTLYTNIGEVNRAITELGSDNANATAQLRVLRAYFYYQLVDLFGNVKIIVDDQDKPQSTRKEVFDFVVKEIKEAISSGKLATERGDVTRINEFAAWALLAKVYINAEVFVGTAMYKEAADAADKVIASGLYAISANYKDVFSPTNTDNIEHILVAPYDQTTTGDGITMNFAQMTLHYGSQQTFNLTDQPWNGYVALEAFYDTYDDADTRKKNNFLVGPQFAADGVTPILDYSAEPYDPDGIQLTYIKQVDQLYPNAMRQGGARLFKFNFKLGQTPNMDNDYPVLRYGDILLIKAEALARVNGNDYNNAETLALVNQLRKRAGVSEFTKMTEDDFYNERGREMFMEVTRRQDLIRFGKWKNAWWEKAATTADHLKLFPIPQPQIAASSSLANKLTQNTGY